MSRVASAALLISAECPYCGDTPAVSLDGRRVPPPDIDIDEIADPVMWSEPPLYRLTHAVPAAPGRPLWKRHDWTATTLTMTRVLALHVEVL